MRNAILEDVDEGARALLTVVDDINQRKCRELMMGLSAGHDSLTGLPGEKELRSRIDERCRSLRGGSGDQTLLLCRVRCRLDLLDAATTQQELEAVLLESVRRISRAMGDHDMLARLEDGSAFAILADRTDRWKAQELVAKIRALFSSPFEVDGTALRVEVELGSTWIRSGMTAQQVIGAAGQQGQIEGVLGGIVRATHADTDIIDSPRSDDDVVALQDRLDQCTERIRRLEHENRELTARLRDA